jgi:hypothetical protein
MQVLFLYSSFLPNDNQVRCVPNAQHSGNLNGGKKLKIPLDKILFKSYIHNMKVSVSGRVGKIVGMAVIGFAIGFNACENPFQTRTPEPPNRVQGTFLLPHSPGIVFINLRNALAELNGINYKSCFSDSFRFIAEATVAVTNADKFANWGVKEESNYFEVMKNPLPPDSAFSLSLDSLRFVDLGNIATFLQSYKLVARHNRRGVPRLFSGRGQFWLSRDPLFGWSIYRWEDFATDDGFTWSTLKAAFIEK